MPLYEYRCSKCQNNFEVIQKFSDEPLTVHEGCGGSVERLLSAPALQFKGSGWYINDYARAGGGKDKGGDSKSESKPESKSETKSESKSDSSSSSSSSSTSSTPATTSTK